MKKEIRKEGKMILVGIVTVIIALVIISGVSAGMFDWIKKTITGRDTASVSINISVGGPTLFAVYNSTITNAESGPTENTITSIIVNFSANSPSGFGNLNHNTAMANITGDDAVTRTNSSCFMYQGSGTNANYTCNISLWWWDGSGTWNITAYVEDNQSNGVQNTSTDFYVGELTAFVMGPGALTWGTLSPGATNQTSSNDPLLLNNTGNDQITSTELSINASNLRGETTSAEALWASNFSVDWDTESTCSGTTCIECDGVQMSRSIFINMTMANLTKGNYTINDGSTGQERLYFCIKWISATLSTQSYSTANETEWNWIVQTI